MHASERNYSTSVRILAALVRVSAGLLIHPYQTMQPMISHPWLVWLTLLPSGVLAVVTVLWRFLIVPLVGILIPCAAIPLHACSLLPFLGNVVTFFCVYWQIMLLYLLFRFKTAFRQ